MPRGRGKSNYRALRLTLTQSDDASYTIVTLTAKRLQGGWDEYTALCPAIRLETCDPIKSSAEAAAVLEEALGLLLLEADIG